MLFPSLEGQTHIVPAPLIPKQGPLPSKSAPALVLAASLSLSGHPQALGPHNPESPVNCQLLRLGF